MSKPERLKEYHRMLCFECGNLQRSTYVECIRCGSRDISVGVEEDPETGKPVFRGVEGMGSVEKQRRMKEKMAEDKYTVQELEADLEDLVETVADELKEGKRE